METKITYQSNGLTTEFAFNFKIFKPENIEVYINNIQQDEGFLTELNETGGTIIFKQAPLAGNEILIKRNLKPQRLNEYQEAGIISAEELNADFEYITELLKQTNELLKFKLTSTKENLKFPTPKSGHAITWSDDEKQLVNSKIDLLQEVLSAQKASNDANKFLQQMQDLLKNSNDGSCYGLITNMFNLLSEKIPELSEDFGAIMDDYTETNDNGIL